MIKIAIVAVLLAATVGSARSDSIEFGAATRCDAKNKTFEISAVVEFNEQTTVVSEKLAQVRQLRHGKHALRCNVGEVGAVTARVEVWPPSNGHCMGGGYVALQSLTIAGRSLLNASLPTPFNFSCSTEREMLVSILVRGRSDLGPGAVEVRRCTAKDWTWDAGYVNFHCTQEQLQ